MADPALQRQIKRRRTFAIISHPDAGKTTLTEKLLLYGGAIHLAGSVKAKKASKFATSDWMELEKQRGISVTSSVLQFEYSGYAVNLLDTPGHQDFSEDTYRTLAATDAAVMLIDGAKGVETQTKKLFKVCRQRGIPIFTFVNKMDRDIRPPLELLDELEAVLGIRSCPVNWPVGSGSGFRGVFDRRKNHFLLFESAKHGTEVAPMEVAGADDPRVQELIGESAHAQLKEELSLLDIAGDPFDLPRVLRGELSPVYFGSAMTNFGVRPFLESFLTIAPPPSGFETSKGRVEPDDPRFSAFVFKIQANMDPAHRDRIAFLRICSGKYTKGLSARHIRLDRELRLANPQQFMAQARTMVEEAYAGDIIGLFDPGHFRIGDTMVAGGEAFEFGGIPHFSPEHFACVRIKDAMKRKQLKKGLDELAQEGAIQVFRQRGFGDRDPYVGAVGQLQFDVLKFRLEHEYSVEPLLDTLPYAHARWVEGEGFDPKALERNDALLCVEDRDGRSVVLFRSDWALAWTRQNFPKLVLRDTAPASIEGIHL
ncbi:MAG TPA: peptide chain release factor 3 [Myxococcales bacterium]